MQVPRTIRQKTIAEGAQHYPSRIGRSKALDRVDPPQDSGGFQGVGEHMRELLTVCQSYTQT